jgi:hypothetical protein
MDISYDPAKRQETLNERGLDFDDAPKVFQGFTLTWPDDRKDYGEDREITVGLLTLDCIVIVWTDRDASRRIISMRKASRDEREYYFRELEDSG